MTPLPQTLDRARVQVALARELCAILPPMYERARAEIARSRSLCLSYRRIRGASDMESPFIVEIISKTPMCTECLSRKTGIEAARIRDGLARMKSFVAVSVETGRCEGCLRTVTVYGLAGADGDGHVPTPTAPARPMLVTQAEAIWRLLESRRGEMFCTQCITSALNATKRIDRAILAAEGRGARRQYGPCATCGKERLLCGLTR